MDAIPKDFLRALRQSGLEKYFDESAYVPRADYLSWIAAAKLPETRRQRIRKTVVRLFAQWQEDMRELRAAFNASEPATQTDDSVETIARPVRRSA